MYTVCLQELYSVIIDVFLNSEGLKLPPEVYSMRQFLIAVWHMISDDKLTWSDRGRMSWTLWYQRYINHYISITLLVLWQVSEYEYRYTVIGYTTKLGCVYTVNYTQTYHTDPMMYTVA